jgi:hypothetical protein
MPGDVHQDRTDDPALWGALQGRGEPAVVEHARLQPPPDQPSWGEGAKRGREVIVAKPVERRFQVGVKRPLPARVPTLAGPEDGLDRVMAAAPGPNP